MTAPVKTENCRQWMSGSCPRGKSCPYIHEGPLQGILAQVAPTTKAAQQLPLPPPPAPEKKSAVPAKAVPAHAKKAPSKARTPSRGAPMMSTGEKRDILCAQFQTGTCNRGERCLFQHVMAEDPAEIQRLAEVRARNAELSRSRSQSPGAATGRPCFEWMRKGTCVHGESCTFAHDPAKKGPPPKSKGGSGPGGSS